MPGKPLTYWSNHENQNQNQKKTMDAMNALEKLAIQQTVRCKAQPLTHAQKLNLASEKTRLLKEQTR